MEPEGESQDLPPHYQSSESTACETETARWGDMDQDEDMDFGYTEKPPSSDPPRRPGGDPPGPPRGGPSGPPEGRPPGGTPGGGPPGGEDPLDGPGPAESLLEDPLGTRTAHRKMVARYPPGGG